MIINGNSINGIFIYKPGIAVEPNDFLLHEGDLYKVISPKYDGALAPNESIFCELYAKQMVSDLLTVSDAERILNDFIKGISIGGSIATINADLMELDEYRSTAVYHLVNNNKNYLLRVYEFEDKLVQELVDYDLPSFQYRFLVGNEWSSWKILINPTDSIIREFLDELSQVNKQVTDKLKKLNESLKFMYCASITPDQNGTYWIPMNGDYLIRLIIRYEELDGTYQTDVTIDPTSMNDDHSAIINVISRSGVKIRVHSSYPLIDSGAYGFNFTSDNPIKILKALLINKY